MNVLQIITKNLFSQEITIFFTFRVIKISGLSHGKQKSFTMENSNLFTLKISDIQN